MSYDFSLLLNDLLENAKTKGFLLFKDLLEISDKYKLGLPDLDRLTNAVVERGVIFYEQEPTNYLNNTRDTGGENDENEMDFDDFAQLDYNPIYNKAIELDPSLTHFITTVRTIVPPQRREINTLKYQVAEGNKYARERLINMYLRLAVKTAVQFSLKNNKPIGDILSLALEGLIRAVDNYKPDENAAFSGYASFWMMQVINREQLTEQPLIYYPVYILERCKFLKNYLSYFKIEEITDLLENEQIKKVTDILRCSRKSAIAVVQALIPMLTLADLYDEERDIMDMGSIVEYNFRIILSDNEAGWFYDLIVKDLNQHLFSLFKTLKERERDVLCMRNGISKTYPFKPLTLEKIAQKYGCTRERVRQIESKAMKKLVFKLNQNQSLNRLKEFM